MPTEPKLELISFKLCPFVQRATIMLNHKEVAYDITYINLKQPPDWFGQISPLGKVPLLKIDNEVLFESAVIVEYLDEITPASLLAADALQRARQRAWIAFASTLNEDFYHLSGASDKNDLEAKVSAIAAKLAILQDNKQAGKWFSGTDFSQVDIAIAPFLMRMELIKESTNDVVAGFPQVKTLADNLLALAAVKNSVAEDFDELFYAMLKARSFYGI